MDGRLNPNNPPLLLLDWQSVKNGKKALDVGLEPTASRLEVLRATIAPAEQMLVDIIKYLINYYTICILPLLIYI
jgi:hypothetical protein